MAGSTPRLSVFDTFKTKKDEPTGEALRQRSIIITLATQDNPTQTTRTAISQKIATDNGNVWKNLYSGIFRDLDEILIPLGIVKETGRLPLKRGPKALQEKGIPFYQLTDSGLLVAMSLEEFSQREKILERFFSQVQIDAEFLMELQVITKFVPRFFYSLLKNYIQAYCDGKFSDLLPLERTKFLSVSKDMVMTQKEFLDAFTGMAKQEKEKTLRFLDEIR
ncbi:MAG TPA: hypothetical protein HA290_02520 [Candidatus Nitrosotenuis sp.]|nr:hypothetical protein [Candidatus Nitrosotenuis sp.]HII03468.1 hypothetical protein [Candidatus Nitrosotenuis sp.]